MYKEELFTPDVYDQKETQIDYGGSKKETIFNKIRFIEKIKQETYESAFENFRPLLERIRSIIAPPKNIEEQAL